MIRICELCQAGGFQLRVESIGHRRTSVAYRAKNECVKRCQHA